MESLLRGNHAGALTTLGRRQARRAATQLAKLPIGAIHHSDLLRARETAAIIHARLPGAPIKPSRLLRECIPYPPLTIPEWMSAISPADLEAGARQAVRAVRKFCRPTRGQDKHELLVCHGNIIRFFVACAIGAPLESWVNMDICHCSITEIRVDPGGGLRLITHNEVGHLPPAMRTFGWESRDP